MTMYEVHVSNAPGLVIPHHVVDCGPLSLRGEGSLFLRTRDRAQAEHVVDVIERTARRVDDGHGWIREVEEPEGEE